MSEKKIMSYHAHISYYAEKSVDKCVNCDICKEIVACPCFDVGNIDKCVGCGACYLACPHMAIELRSRMEEVKEVRIKVDGEVIYVPEKITVKRALEIAGFKFSKFPKFPNDNIFNPCGVGGCYACAVEINGVVRPSCVTKVMEGMEIKTRISESQELKRLLHGWMGHPVGGVGTPWWLKGKGYVEVAVFACGCNLRCPQCQNWTTTYNGRVLAYTPKRAAEVMTYIRRRYGVDRMAISGGECTLNRRWLIQYIKELKRLNPDREARFHIDTNTTILTSDYIDELVEVGVTDIGPDLKGLSVETFMKITGIVDRELAEKYHKTSWQALKYLVDRYKGTVFIGVGIPYNKDLITYEEIAKIGDEICRIDSELQVCVLDYRPEFRKRSMSRPSFNEMIKVWKMLKATGLKTVICQTIYGHIGPNDPKLLI
ncbi:MAG: radical SAM protein [Nitrososphaerales archaeon]|nr:radical SAM protein [Nitrososphaerales archaeon]